MPPVRLASALTRRRLIAGIVAAGSALLAACGTSSAQTRPTSAAAPATSAAASSSQHAAAGAPSKSTAASATAASSAPYGQQVTIRLLAWGDQQEQKARHVTLAAFEQQYPDINVDYMLTQAGGGYLTKLNSMIASNDPPDVIFLGNGDMWQYATLGSLLPISPLIARDHFDTSDINQQVYKLYNVDNVQYGFPVDAPSQQLYVNLTAYQEASAPPPSYDWKDSSWTWDAFLARAQKLVKRDGAGNVTRYAFPVQTGFRSWWIWVASNGGKMFNEDGTQCLLNEPAAVEALQFLADLIHKYQVAPTIEAAKTMGTFNTFLSGNLAMITNAPFIEETRLGFKGGTWDVAPNPGGKAGKACSGGGTGHHIGKGTKYPEQAWTFMKWVIAKPAVTLWTQQMGIVPPLVSLEQSEVFLQPGQPPAHIKVFTEGLAYLAADPRHPKWPLVQAAIGKSLGDLWSGAKNAQDATASAVHDANGILQSK